jgi:hypothetical protein
MVGGEVLEVSGVGGLVSFGRDTLEIGSSEVRRDQSGAQQRFMWRVTQV